MKVKVLCDFFDREDEKKRKKAGSILEVSRECAEKLAGLGLVETVEEQQEKERQVSRDEIPKKTSGN